ncbi:hypothetical protein [Devosia sp.]|uniref:hypothetical protein n=1 Tax=Devosia sp. TaxID=1871048 RepID=UPI002FC6E306
MLPRDRPRPRVRVRANIGIASERAWWSEQIDLRAETVRVGESSYYSGMYVDVEGLLQMVNPSIGPSSLIPQCKCCTHTFNGIPFTKPFMGLRETAEPGGASAA